MAACNAMHRALFRFVPLARPRPSSTMYQATNAKQRRNGQRILIPPRSSLSMCTWHGMAWHGMAWHNMGEYS